MDIKDIISMSKDLTKIQIETLEKSLKLADKHNFNRNDIVQTLAKSFKIFSEIADFTDYKFKED